MAAEQSAVNPFYTGAGSVPDRLVGREPEQALIKRSLDDICGERKRDYGPLRGRPPQHLKIVGPRGMGKMALLDWARREAESMDADFARMSHEPNADSKDALSALLLQLADIPGLDRKQISDRESDYLQWALDWQPGKPALEFKRILAIRLRFRPLMLVLDDVIHYDMSMLDLMLNQYQLLARSGWPLALVLVGTPTLNSRLIKTKAGFIHRSEDIHINALDPDATREALGRPFLDRGVMVSDEALKLMVSWTDNYPYFTQIVGSEVWEAKQGAAKVDVALVRSVEQAVQKQRNDFYESIYRKIDKAQLLEHARKAVAAIEAAPEPPEVDQVIACLAEGTDLDGKGALKVYNQLLDAGLFWKAGAGGVSAAIPSFFNYFKKKYKRGQSQPTSS